MLYQLPFGYCTNSYGDMHTISMIWAALLTDDFIHNVHVQQQGMKKKGSKASETS